MMPVRYEISERIATITLNRPESDEFPWIQIAGRT